MSSLDLLLFDLDGTLYQSTSILPRAYREGIEHFLKKRSVDCEMPEKQEILDQVGNPPEEICRNLFPDLNTEQQQQLSDEILHRLTELIRDGGGQLIDGVPETLAVLNGVCPLALVTNARIDYMEAVLDTYELAPFFQRMKCIEMVESELKEQLVRDMLNEFDVPPDRVILVGDRESDRIAAKSAGTAFVGCRFGYSTGEEFADHPTIEKFSELQNHPLIANSLMQMNCD